MSIGRGPVQNTIVDATAVPQIYPTPPPPRGIHAISSQMTVSNNTIWGTIFGMDIVNANASTIIRDNQFRALVVLSGPTEGPVCGVYLDNASVRVEWNSFAQADLAIYCIHNANASISNDTIANGGDGIYCLGASPIIRDNTITGNIGSGIWLETNSNANVVHNNVTGNLEYGIYVFDSNVLIDHSIFNNSGKDGIFINNAVAVLTYNYAWYNAQWDLHLMGTCTVTDIGNSIGTRYP